MCICAQQRKYEYNRNIGCLEILETYNNLDNYLLYYNLLQVVTLNEGVRSKFSRSLSL